MGLSVGLEIGPRWGAGGAGISVLKDIPVQDDLTGPSELRLGYAGVWLEWTAPPAAVVGSTDFEARLRLLAGAGNAELRQSPLGTLLASDNFAVLEPSASLERRLGQRLGIGAWAGYRVALDVQNLPGLDASDLDGLALGLRLRLGPF